MSGIPDVSDPATFAEGFPHEVFRHLRNESPVHWQERDHDGARGFWIVSRYEDVKHVSKNPRLFCSERGTNIRDMQAQQGGRMMLMMDPPDHGRYRRLVSAGFTPRRIEALESHIESIVDADILGGIVLRVGNSILDASVRHRLEQLRKEVAKAA